MIHAAQLNPAACVALLFCDYLYRKLGKDKFYAFTSDLFNRDSLNTASFRQAIEDHLPGSGAVISLWLQTDEYPDKILRPAGQDAGR